MTTALIIGRGKGLWEEISAAQALTNFDFTLAVGPIAVDYPGKIDAWVWFHTEQFEDCALRRAKKGFPPVKEYWSVKYAGRVRSKGETNISFLSWNGGGASGLVATVIALREFKADRVALAGIPMTKDGGQYDSKKPWAEAEKHRAAWTKNLPMLIGKVRSFSGWTLELLGGEPPTAEWLQPKEVCYDCDDHVHS